MRRNFSPSPRLVAGPVCRRYPGLPGLFMVYADKPVWEGWRASGELQRPVYGERIFVDSIFRTRANTWSNLAYVFVGIYVMVIGIFDWRRSAPMEDASLRRDFGPSP